MLLIIHGVVVLSFLVLGLVFLRGKGAFLIAGYNTAPKGKKEQIDEKKLCRCVGRLMFSLAGCFLVVMASDIFRQMWLLWLGLALFFGVVIGGIIYMNTGDHIRK